MLRGIVFLALIGGAGFSAWTSFQNSSRSPLDWAISEVRAMVAQHDGEVAVEGEHPVVEAEPTVLQTDRIPDHRFTISKETLAAITCGPWDISDVGIEAILQEMIRRGWTPPSGAKALEASRVSDVAAIDPDSPVPAYAPPAIAAEASSSAKEASSF